MVEAMLEQDKNVSPRCIHDNDIGGASTKEVSEDTHY